MGKISAVTGDQLASALHNLGVNFILGGTNADQSLHRRPALLIAALAGSAEARLRLALIPLFLDHPEFAEYVPKAAQILDAGPRLVLQCYYTAAVLLQQVHRTRLNVLIGEQQALPDLFSRELGLKPARDPEKTLELLAERHQELSGAKINWLGTYQHAVRFWLKSLGLQVIG